MAGLVGHAIVGAAIARAAGLGGRQTALATAFSLVPDLDVLVSMAIKGDGHAWHRAPWSHSPAAATVAAAAVSLGSLAFEAARNGAAEYGQALKAGAVAWTILASHVVLDFWLDNPFEVGGPPRFHHLHEIPGLVRHQLLNLPGEALFYGSLAYTLYRGGRWLQGRLAQGGASSAK